MDMTELNQRKYELMEAAQNERERTLIHDTINLCMSYQAAAMRGLLEEIKALKSTINGGK